MNDCATFQALPNLSEPWFISGIDIDTPGEAMHVHIDFRRDACLPCPACAALTAVDGSRPR